MSVAYDESPAQHKQPTPFQACQGLTSSHCTQEVNGLEVEKGEIEDHQDLQRVLILPSVQDIHGVELRKIREKGKEERACISLNWEWKCF